MRKADNLPPSLAVVTKSGNLNFREPSGPVQACNGTDFFYYMPLHVSRVQCSKHVEAYNNLIIKQDFVHQVG